MIIPFLTTKVFVHLLYANRNGRRKQFSICFSPFLSYSCVLIPPNHLFCIVGKTFHIIIFSWFLFYYMIFLITLKHSTHRVSILNSRTAQLFHEVLCVRRRIMLETYGLMTPMHPRKSKDCV